jgi:DNA repair exonuclease SbcCD nuclease subunit
MIKILFLADTHLGFDYPVKPRIERRRRGEDFFNNFKSVLKFAENNKADLVIHGGDFFFRTKVPKKIVAIAYDILFDFAEKGIPFIIVPGNHESSILPSSLILQHNNIYVFFRPQTFYFNINETIVAISGFPFERKDIRNKFPSIVNEIISKREKADINLLCMHQAIEGATVGPVNFTFRYGEDVIQKKDIPDKFQSILSGHIHRKQILRSINNQPIIYPGSTERTSFAEKDEEKGFFLLEFIKDHSEYILKEPNFIHLPARPMVDLKIELDTKEPEILKNFLLRRISKIDKNSIVRLDCKNNNTSKLLTSKLIKEIFPNTINIQWRGGFGSI